MNNPKQHKGHGSLDKGILLIGDGTQIDDSVILDLADDIIIGNNCKICRGVKIFTHDHLFDDGLANELWLKIKTNQVVIEDNVWIGEDSLILHQAETINEGAIIGIGSVVTKPIPAWEIWAGNPAKKVGQRKHKINKTTKKYIIMAAGEETRWGNYLGINKHLVPTETGEVLLNRTVRLLKQFDPYAEIWVIARHEYYEIEGANLFIPVLTPEYFGADRFLSSKEIWEGNWITVFLYGDVYYTEEALYTVSHFNDSDLMFFGRFGSSGFTGKGWGELFGVYVAEGKSEFLLEKLMHLVSIRDGRVVIDINGWELYRAVVGLGVKQHQIKGNYIEIDDFTEDFDYPQDYDNWLKKIKEFKNK